MKLAMLLILLMCLGTLTGLAIDAVLHAQYGAACTLLLLTAVLSPSLWLVRRSY